MLPTTIAGAAALAYTAEAEAHSPTIFRRFLRSFLRSRRRWRKTAGVSAVILAFLTDPPLQPAMWPQDDAYDVPLHLIGRPSDIKQHRSRRCG